ncbi:E3 ubiquitin-protein ligase RMA2-like [Zingiber officinale]|uniref:E3 ubiquitin-protein ligase RMA n=1 Tax=Zingiber officinale TaxID=94328 RepID=A0A8J5GYE6_ZINOF|nr:E3 ubiquitin-protein ligase RMA2-like [Zingiber officinale]KAG6515502.1 hypothetical protein ZIOFF_025916 [Zingiber officinale]
MAVNRASASCGHWEQKMEPERAAEEQQGDDTGTDAAASIGGCFDCNICLDFAADPVVTLCGHLYCWPCIYQWLQQDDGAAPRQCPVCKAVLLPRSFVPLYGRGSHVPTAAHRNPASSDVPRRPSFRHEATAVRLQQQQQRRVPSPTPPPPLRAMHSTSVEVLWGMAVAVLPWVCRRGYESPYGGGSARARRRELAVERTLHHIWVFLFCCVMLCLFLF